VEEALQNSYVYWIITGAVGLLLSLVVALVKKQVAALEKRVENSEEKLARIYERMNELIAQMPVQYTLRDEFLRVTTDQNRKLDKMNDTLGELSSGIAAIRTAVTGGVKE
jgi:methyl-accepting chemotaxis protein